MIQKITVSLRLKTGIGEIVMANNACRKLPVGIQSFNKIKEEGYLYVDKSDIIWKLANNGKQYSYLTIKSSDEFGYFLGFPNQEVRQALYEVVLPTSRY